MKKIISNILSAVLSISLLLPIAGCVGSGTQGTGSGDTSSSVAAPSGYLALNTYSVKLKVGETLTLDVKKYGVIVSTKGFLPKRGLLLPDLAGVDTVEEQIAIAKKKANIRDGEKVKLQRFTVERHEV